MSQTNTRKLETILGKIEALEAVAPSQRAALLDTVLANQVEIMGALSLLLRCAKPDLVGLAGELATKRDELLDRHKATQVALRQAATNQPGYTQYTGYRP